VTRVTAYFAQQAHAYESKTARFPWSWLRARELNAVGRLLGDVSGRDVLELGAGAGFYTRYLIRRGARHVWAVDVTAEMLAMLPAGPITPVLGDARSVRIERSFPILISTGMLEFIHDPEAALANAAHLAEPNARFVLLAPLANMPGLLYRRFHRGHGLDIYLFNRAWFETVAPRTGWQVRATVPVRPFSLAVQLSRIA
jgi:SAM-dependent methyltransferase